MLQRLSRARSPYSSCCCGGSEPGAEAGRPRLHVTLTARLGIDDGEHPDRGQFEFARNPDNLVSAVLEKLDVSFGSHFVCFVPMPHVPASSTAVRAHLAHHEPTPEVPPGVATYIHRYGLYE